MVWREGKIFSEFFFSSCSRPSTETVRGLARRQNFSEFFFFFFFTLGREFGSPNLPELFQITKIWQTKGHRRIRTLTLIWGGGSVVWRMGRLVRAAVEDVGGGNNGGGGDLQAYKLMRQRRWQIVRRTRNSTGLDAKTSNSTRRCRQKLNDAMHWKEYATGPDWL